MAHFEELGLPVDHYTLSERVCEVSHWMLRLPSGTPLATTASVKFHGKLNTTAWHIYFANTAHKNTLTIQESGLNAEAIIFSCGLQLFSVATFGWLFLRSLLPGETWNAELYLIFELQFHPPCPLLAVLDLYSASRNLFIAYLLLTTFKCSITEEWYKQVATDLTVKTNLW